MSEIKEPNPPSSIHTLSDDEITSVAVPRRRFLGAVGIPITAAVGALLITGCFSSDQCDFDTQTDIDFRDPSNRPHDRCDSDGT